MANDPELSEAVAAFQRGELDRARDLAERQLEREPGSPHLQHLLGLIECRSGNLDSGVERLRSAAEAEPNNAAFRVMLVRALLDSGDLDYYAFRGKQCSSYQISQERLKLKGDIAPLIEQHPDISTA